ncbi:unnamed protein product [Effrenium voratum]|nr:unnamed protein product [Effrenium voratum]
MHGSIAATSASTKILTQAVRPPVASLLEIQGAMRIQEEYESGGLQNYLQVPAVFKDSDLPRTDRVSQNTGGLRRAKSVPVLSPKKGHIETDNDGLRWIDETAHASEKVLEMLRTEDAGPGQSAALYSHFWMLRKVHRGYACFDAYARISLAVSAQQLLLVEAYYSLGHFMSKSEGWPSPVQNTEGAWLALLMGVFACWILFKLDLYMRKRQRQWVQAGLWLAPCLTGLATQLFNVRTEHGEGGVRPCDQVVPVWLPWLVALLACACHVLWILIILWVSTPVLAHVELPISFRSAIYLDVFGWHSRHFRAAAVENSQGTVTHWDPAEKKGDQMDDQRRVFLIFKEAKRLTRQLAKLSRPEAARHFSVEDKKGMDQLKSVLDEELKDLESQLSMPWSRQTSDWSRQSSPFGSSWLQSACDDGSGTLVPYWVETRQGQVVWSRPDGHILDLMRLTDNVQELLDRINTSEDKTDALVAAEALPFELMPVYPDTEESSSILPWMSLKKVCWAQLIVWGASIVVVLFNPVYYDTPMAPRELYNPWAIRKLEVDWPHPRFRPSALACSTQDATVFVGDQFAIYGGDLYWAEEPLEDYENNVRGVHAAHHHLVHQRLLETAGPQQALKLQNMTLHPAIPSIELEVSWTAFGILRRKGRVLLLDRTSSRIVEQSIYPWIPGKKIWRLGPSLPHKRLEALAVSEGRNTICAKRKGFVNMGWAIIAATDSGQVVLFCPNLQDELHAVEMVVSLRHRAVAESVPDIYDSYTGSITPRQQKIIGISMDSELEVLWILSQSSEGDAEILLFDLRGQRVAEKWAMPTGRWWVPGLCDLGPGQGLLVASAADTNPGGPELWRFLPLVNPLHQKWVKERAAVR